MILRTLFASTALWTLSACGSDDGSSGAPPGPALPQPAAEFVPEASGACPGFADGAGCTSDAGSLICTFSPATLVPRPVRIWISEAARERDGALVVFWHGLTRNAGDAALGALGLGPEVVADVVAQGGIVAAPERSEKRQATSLTELPWLLALGSGDEDDLLVMDEIVACAHQEVGIDLRRIHSTGISAGGLQTGAAAPRRSGYLASTVVYSGGQIELGIAEQDAENKYPVLLFHGGDTDMVVLQFKTTQTQYHDRLREAGHFALLCDHGRGHSVPPESALAGWEFMQAHPFGVTPEPYADELPPALASCSLDD